MSNTKTTAWDVAVAKCHAKRAIEALDLATDSMVEPTSEALFRSRYLVEIAKQDIAAIKKSINTLLAEAIEGKDDSEFPLPTAT